MTICKHLKFFLLFWSAKAGKQSWYLLTRILYWDSSDVRVCNVEWTLPLIGAISISFVGVSTITQPREKGSGCDKKDSVKQWMSLSVIALVPIYRANKSKSLQMKHTGLGAHVCSQVTGYGNTLVRKMTLWGNLPKTLSWQYFLIVSNHYLVKTHFSASVKGVGGGAMQGREKQQQRANWVVIYSYTNLAPSQSWQQRTKQRKKKNRSQAFPQLSSLTVRQQFILQNFIYFHLLVA